jgi:hypothetical protein
MRTIITDQELINSVYRAQRGDAEHTIWAVVVNSPMVLPTLIEVDAPNSTMAKKIAREYAWRILEIPAPTAPTATKQ